MALRRAKKDSNTAGSTEKQAGRGSLAIMFVMMLAVFLVGAGMVVGYFKFFDPDKKNAEAEQKKKEVVMYTMELGDMVVNLADQDNNHFLKLTITIEYQADKKIEEKIKKKKHLITETMLLTLRGKTVDQVKPPDAIDQLKGELVAAVNRSLGEELVSKIYFTEFIVQ